MTAGLPGPRQGGSTLTQQLVQSYFLDSRRTLRRKGEEAIMAFILESRFETVDIMNAYINEISLGQDGNRAVHGFGLASQFYFSLLTLAVVLGSAWLLRRQVQALRQASALVLASRATRK